MIYDNKRILKRRWIILSILFSIILSSPIIFLYYSEILNGILLFIALVVILSLLLYFLNYLIFYKRKHRVMKVDKGIFVYESYRTSYEIDSLSIRKVAIYKKKRRTVSYFFMLSDGFTISTDEISDKSISILDSLPLIEKEKIDLRVPFKTVIKRLFILLKEFIRKEYKNILLVLFGLVITALSFILYLNGTLNGIPLIISLILAFIYGIGHIYYTYIRRLFNDMTKLSRIVFSIIVSIVFLVIVFVINIILFMLFMKKPFSINYLYYSIFLLPSFTIVVVVMVLLLIALSYS